MKTIFRITYLASFLILLTNCNLFAQKTNENFIKIDSLIKTTNIRQFNGVILIGQNGKTIYSKAYGFANFEKKTLLNIDDQFEIMSNSKQITAVLILKEAEKGKIDLQSSIRRYLPDLTQTWTDSVTVHQLLNHTHGISDIEKPLLFKPGTDFKYGNLSNILLGKIIEFSSKRTYAEMANELFKKLKMKNTWAYSKEKTQKVVFGHINKENSFEVVNSTQIKDESIPADGIITTAKDLLIWNDNLHQGKILKPETYKLMTTSTVFAQHDVFGKEKAGYGYGIRICENDKTKYIGHTGLGDGFASMNLYFPKNNLSLIVLENQMNEKIELSYYFGTEIKKIILKSE
ncbi:serine hydrolase domain-containing protein [Flavobacterium aestuarii]|uniref:serine hydrolase domain-containing protein n=1 Tax=Flavobacterium aestuarii TaxID=3149227 RepID=UPI0032B40208